MSPAWTRSALLFPVMLRRLLFSRASAVTADWHSTIIALLGVIGQRKKLANQAIGHEKASHDDEVLTDIEKANVVNSIVIAKSARHCDNRTHEHGPAKRNTSQHPKDSSKNAYPLDRRQMPERKLWSCDAADRAQKALGIRLRNIRIGGLGGLRDNPCKGNISRENLMAIRALHFLPKVFVRAGKRLRAISAYYSRHKFSPLVGCHDSRNSAKSATIKQTTLIGNVRLA